ncbi:MAG: hypothetical protein D6692_02100 [Planctomycetota bacterium]|nr:MAG: hypothetical protein D6692_02100 [Planctomycetota bacterium]
MRTLILTVIAAATLAGGCQPAKKVQRTLALNELQNAAGYAEQQGDTAKAMELWTEYVTRRPHEAMAQYRLGILKLSNGMPREAADHLWIAHDLKPDRIDYLEALAEALHQSGERDAMFQLLRDTIEEGGLAEGHLRYAKFAGRAGLVDEAEESLRIAAALDGDRTDRAYRLLAQLARQTGDTEAEKDAWRHVLWFDRSDEEANARLSELGMIPGPSLALPPRTE